MNDVVAPDFHALSRPLEFTAAAAAKVRELIAEEGNPGLKLRAYIQGGGCSGFQYGLRLEETKQEDDAELEIEGVKVLVDPMSYTMLGGVTVDFIDSLTHTGFKFDNPNATSQCSCGQSFSA